MPRLDAPLYPVAPAVYLPPLHNLLASAVQAPDEPGSRWELGFQVEPEGWADVTAIPGTWCGDDLYQDKPVQAPPDPVVYLPFQVVTSYSCSWGRTGQERRDKVRRQLDAGQAKAIERELWTGALSAAVDGTPNMSLALYGTGGGGALTTADKAVVRNPGYNPATAVTTATPVDIGSAVAILSQALADYGPGAKGMIHMSPRAGEVAVQRGIAVEDGRGGSSVLRTKSRGDLIVVGSGYDGSGPGGDNPADPDHEWVHATPMVYYRLGDIQVLPPTDAEAVDRASNTWNVYAERTVAAYWDGLFQASVLVDLGLPATSGA